MRKPQVIAGGKPKGDSVIGKGDEIFPWFDGVGFAVTKGIIGVDFVVMDDRAVGTDRNGGVVHTIDGSSAHHMLVGWSEHANDNGNIVVLGEAGECAHKWPVEGFGYLIESAGAECPHGGFGEQDQPGMIHSCGDDRLGYESKVGGFICVGADLANGDFHGGPRVTLSSPTVGGISRW